MEVEEQVVVAVAAAASVEPFAVADVLSTVVGTDAGAVAAAAA